MIRRIALFFSAMALIAIVLHDWQSREARVLFVGDMMFDRSIRLRAEQYGYEYPFSCITPYFSDFDFVVGNLEGPITAYPSVSIGTVPGEPDNTRFTFDSRVAQVLADVGVDAVDLGNNHIFDFGHEGAASTMSALYSAGVIGFGAPGYSSVATTTVEGFRIALISFNQFLGGDSNQTISDIEHVRPVSDYVVVYAHWGDEYQPENQYQMTLARQFADAGADLIVGSHPHVIQGSEQIGDSVAYYSLGNFIFDQYWNDAVQTGLGLEVSLKKSGVSISERRVTLDRSGLVCPNYLDTQSL